MSFWNSWFRMSVPSQSACWYHSNTTAVFTNFCRTKRHTAQQKVEGNRSTLQTDVDNMDLILSCLRMGCVSEKRWGHASGRLAEQMTRNIPRTVRASVFIRTVMRKINQPNEMCTLIVNVISYWSFWESEETSHITWPFGPFSRCQW